MEKDDIKVLFRFRDDIKNTLAQFWTEDTTAELRKRLNTIEREIEKISLDAYVMSDQPRRDNLKSGSFDCLD